MSAVYVSNSLRSWPCFWADRVSKVAVIHGGAGHHIDAVLMFAPEKLMYWGRLCLIVIPILYSVATTLPKLVILSAYLRIFVLKWSRIACYIIGTTVVTSCTINVILCIWQCSPPDYVWNKTIVNGYCREDFQAHIRWGQLPNVLTDVAMLVLPLVCTYWSIHYCAHVS